MSDETLALTFCLRRPSATRHRPGSVNDLAELLPRVSRQELASRRERELARAIAGIHRFARRHGMTVVSADAARCRVNILARHGSVERAFGTKPGSVHRRGRHARAPKRSRILPADLSSSVHAVLGLDSRLRVKRGLRPMAGPDGAAGLLPTAMAALYGMRTGGQGKGQSIAIIEPAGGYDRADLVQSFANMALAVPEVVDVNVGAGVNAFGQNVEADKEVALDIQVAGAVAPGATLVVYFCENNERGLADGVAQAVHDQVHAPSVIVITWGEPEVQWPRAARAAMDAALADAISLGVTVIVAAGDNLATDGMMDGRAHVDYPASSPYALSCGGTLLTLDASGTRIDREDVWNERTRGTGGGISDVYAIPAYQQRTTLPVSVNHARRGRGVPDMAAAASDTNGYRIVVNGSPLVTGGTSAVAPLVGGFVALLNEQRGHAVGFINPALYEAPALLRPVTSGDNRSFGTNIGYDAGPGWSACAGLGSPRGPEIARVLANPANRDTG